MADAPAAAARDHWTHDSDTHHDGPPNPDSRLLTDRELDVVRLMALGLSNEEIASEAHISRATVKSHVSSVLSKLGLTSRIQVVVWAYEHGLAGSP